MSDRKAREAKLEREAADAVWLGRIRSALDEDLLLLLGQPIIDLASGETVQHELLLRMCDLAASSSRRACSCRWRSAMG